MHRFTLVIETNSYAGDFERELAAWLTGKTQKGLPRDHGYRMAWASMGAYSFNHDPSNPAFPLFEVMEWIQTNVVYVTKSGNEGYENVCEIRKSKKKDRFNSVGIFLAASPPEEVMAFIRLRSEGFNKANSSLWKFLYGDNKTSRIKFLDFYVEKVN